MLFQEIQPRRHRLRGCRPRSLGEFGRFQFVISFSLCLVSVAVSWQMLSMNFLAAKSDFWCSQPNASLDFLSEQQWKNFSRPILKDGKEDKCRIFDLDYSDFEQLTSFNSSNSSLTVACTSFTYDTSFWKQTIVQKFNLVCDREKLIPFINAIFMSGVTVGVYISGMISDRFGRKPTLLGLLVLSVSSGLGAAHADNFELWIALRWFTYACAMSMHTVRFILSMELLSGRHRVMIGPMFSMTVFIGIMSLPFIVKALMDSFKIQMVMSLAIVPLMILYVFIPESPRWLISRGRFEEAKVVLTRGAKFNDREVPKVWSFEHSASEKAITPQSTNPVNTLSLFRTKHLRMYTLGMYLLWFAHGFVYYGIGLNIGNLGGDLFTSFFLFGLVDVPATFVCCFFLTVFKRKITLLPVMVLTGVSLLATTAFEKGEYPGDWPIVMLAMIAKFCLSITFTTIYTYSVEVFPTVVRNVGMGSSSSFSRIGSILAPLTFSLAYVNPAFFPTGLLGLVFLLCSASLILLPETFGSPLLKTIEELEEGGKGKDVFGRTSWGFAEKEKMGEKS